MSALDSQVGKWIEWGGGICPVSLDEIVLIDFRDGTTSSEPRFASYTRWEHRGDSRDVIRYFVVPSSEAKKVPVNAKTKPKHSHYFKDVSALKVLDVYRVLQLFNVTDPCLGHAIKKLLVAGGRGGKDIEQDVGEAIDTLERWKDMNTENGAFLTKDGGKTWAGLGE